MCAHHTNLPPPIPSACVAIAPVVSENGTPHGCPPSHSAKASSPTLSSLSIPSCTRTALPTKLGAFKSIVKPPPQSRSPTRLALTPDIWEALSAIDDESDCELLLDHSPPDVGLVSWTTMETLMNSFEYGARR
ncbi:unnamed protein product [Agarophyton chilense]